MSGILEVSAEDRSYPRRILQVISEVTGGFTKGELEKMMRELEDCVVAWSLQNKRVEELLSLENYVLGIQANLDLLGIELEKQEKVKELVNELLVWIETHQRADIHEFVKKKELIYHFITGKELTVEESPFVYINLDVD